MLAITMGDPAGIGPEIITSAWSEIVTICQEPPLVLGHGEILRRAAQLQQLNLEIEEIDLQTIANCSNRLTDSNDVIRSDARKTLHCVRAVDDDVLAVRPGQIDPIAGKAAYDALALGIDLALAKKVDAIVTAPLQKESLNLAGFPYPGHTEILAEKCGCSDFGMMLYLGPGQNLQGQHGLAVVHVTLHTSMRKALNEITEENVVAKAMLIDRFMRKIKGSQPKIGVCSLNPHAGENGLFGDEEIRIIRPGIEQARSQGLSIEGPFPADTIMMKAKKGQFDAIVAMFHDQGHIALKLLGMHRAVNITLGLPIIRTSVAHGTAFDIAGTGRADHRSLIEAVRVAQKLA
ncbi:MAG: 4-hydroxythreonine-4-phosphate dehydrogenase PdxA [Thermoguttaceae bacterium]